MKISEKNNRFGSESKRELRPYTSEMREWLEWKGSEFTEYDVECDSAARERFRKLAQPPFAVPLLVEDGRVVQVGWQGRNCVVDA
jgi:hypothetical protein